MVLGIGVIDLSTRLEVELHTRWPLLFGGTAEAARATLTTIASSMITVTGVAFSITVVALSIASSQYTSRVLRNFMGDRTNQATLGVTIGVFAYCVIVLRTVRGTEDLTFIPSLAILIAVLFAFMGTGFLIYFVHHVAASIQATHIISSVFEETRHTIDTLFSDDATTAPLPLHSDPLDSVQHWAPIATQKTGYIQRINHDALVRYAAEDDVLLRMAAPIGGFLVEGQPLVYVADRSSVSQSFTERVNTAYTVSKQRTVDQDVRYGLQQIVDVALKALSPGINDTNTAVMAVDYLSALVARIGTRRVETPYRFAGGTVRLLTLEASYEQLVTEALSPIRRHGHTNLDVLMRLLMTFETLLAFTPDPERQGILLGEVKALGQHLEDKAFLAQDVMPLKTIYQNLLAQAKREGVG